MMVPVGGYGSFLPGMVLSGLWGGLWAVYKVESSAWAPRLPRFILLPSFSDTLLVVSILDIAIAICSHLYSPEGG